MSKKRRQPKCMYCLGSKLTNEIFEDILLFLIMGTSAEEAKTIMNKRHPSRDNPSERTIRSYYERIGEVLFSIAFEPHLKDIAVETEDASSPPIPLLDIRERDQRLFEQCLQELLHALHKSFMLVDANADLPWAEDFPEKRAARYRKMAAQRNGIRGQSIKTYIGVAFFIGLFSMHKTKKNKPQVRYPPPESELFNFAWTQLRAFFIEYPIGSVMSVEWGKCWQEFRELLKEHFGSAQKSAT